MESEKMEPGDYVPKPDEDEIILQKKEDIHDSEAFIFTPKKIIEDSFDKNLRKNKESKASYTSNLLDKKFSDYIWNVMYIYLGDNNSYSFSGNGTNYFCIFKNYGIIIYALKEKNEEIERLEEDIKSISNEKSELKDKLNDSEIKIKNYEFIINEHKLKSEK